jgi:hypothetical protein
MNKVLSGCARRDNYCKLYVRVNRNVTVLINNGMTTNGGVKAQTHAFLTSALSWQSSVENLPYYCIFLGMGETKIRIN